MSHKAENHDHFMANGEDTESEVTLLSQEWKQPRAQSFSRRRAIILSVAALTTLTSMSALFYITLTLHNLQRTLHLHPTGTELGDCGSSRTVSEARSKGCVFDPMSWLWVRPQCYDASLIDDFMNRTTWSWHTDPKLTPNTQVPLEDVFAGEHPQLFTAKKYHSIHCTYMWQKMHKALLEGRPVDTDLTSWHHTRHCEQVLLDQYLHEDEECTEGMVCPTLVRATWTSCGYV